MVDDARGNDVGYELSGRPRNPHVVEEVAPLLGHVRSKIDTENLTLVTDIQEFASLNIFMPWAKAPGGIVNLLLAPIIALAHSASREQSLIIGRHLFLPQRRLKSRILSARYKLWRGRIQLC